MSRETITVRTHSGSLGLGGTLFITFLVLKLTDTVDWSWWWVTAPLWGPVVLALAIFAVVALIALIVFLLAAVIK